MAEKKVWLTNATVMCIIFRTFAQYMNFLVNTQVLKVFMVLNLAGRLKSTKIITLKKIKQLKNTTRFD